MIYLIIFFINVGGNPPPQSFAGTPLASTPPHQQQPSQQQSSQQQLQQAQQQQQVQQHQPPQQLQLQLQLQQQQQMLLQQQQPSLRPAIVPAPSRSQNFSSPLRGPSHYQQTPSPGVPVTTPNILQAPMGPNNINDITSCLSVLRQLTEKKNSLSKLHADMVSNNSNPEIELEKVDGILKQLQQVGLVIR